MPLLIIILKRYIKEMVVLSGKTSLETRYLITSMETVSKVVRKHWSVEDQLHWILDVTDREVESKVR